MRIPSWRQLKSNAGLTNGQAYQTFISVSLSAPPSEVSSGKGNFRSGYQDWAILLLLLLLLLAVSGLTACAPAISSQLRDEAGVPIAFEDLISQPDIHKGRIVILGGYILETVNEPGATTVMVLQAPLDFQNKPRSQDLSKGRFLIRADKFLDPEIYARGRMLSVGGRVSGAQEQPIGNRTYRYPLIEAEELRLWPKEARYIRNYDPFYDDWYYPWHPWHPWYPWYRHPYRPSHG